MTKVRFPFLVDRHSCRVALLMVAFFGWQACTPPNAPLDADTRVRIDSIANAQIAKAQSHYDSLCKSAQVTLLPHLVDSIKQVRLREIAEQLKTVPK